MAQITILNRHNQVIDAYIVSQDLYQKLSSVAVSSSLEFFTVSLLEELRAKFLESVIQLFDLSDRDKSTLWHLNKANFHALSIYPWYSEFVSLFESINRLSVNNSDLIIRLTTL